MLRLQWFGARQHTGRHTIGIRIEEEDTADSTEHKEDSTDCRADNIDYE